MAIVSKSRPRITMVLISNTAVTTYTPLRFPLKTPHFLFFFLFFFPSAENKTGKRERQPLSSRCLIKRGFRVVSKARLGCTRTSPPPGFTYPFSVASANQVTWNPAVHDAALSHFRATYVFCLQPFSIREYRVRTMNAAISKAEWYRQGGRKSGEFIVLRASTKGPGTGRLHGENDKRLEVKSSLARNSNSLLSSVVSKKRAYCCPRVKSALLPRDNISPWQSRGCEIVVTKIFRLGTIRDYSLVSLVYRRVVHHRIPNGSSRKIGYQRRCLWKSLIPSKYCDTEMSNFAAIFLRQYHDKSLRSRIYVYTLTVITSKRKNVTLR